MIVIELVGFQPEGLDMGLLDRAIAALNSAQLDIPAGTINLRLVDDAEIRKLNKEYSGNDYATDVLSFSYIEAGESIDGDIGDMAISLETAQRQALAVGSTLAEEIALLGLHGVLHIIGFDHATEKDRLALDHLHREILTAAHIAYRDFKWES